MSIWSVRHRIRKIYFQEKKMESYQGVLYSITLTGFLNSKPLLYHSPEGEKRAEFFVKTTSHSDYLNRIFVGADEAEKIRANGYPGVKLFLEGELIKYSIINLNNETYIIPEIFAKKIWFLSSTEPEECKAEKSVAATKPFHHLSVTLH